MIMKTAGLPTINEQNGYVSIDTSEVHVFMLTFSSSVKAEVIA